MKRNFLLCFLIFFSLSLRGWEGRGDDRALAAVLYCFDGDTCRVKTNAGLWFNARLFGIDAQETERKGRKKSPGQPFAEPAKKALNQKIKGKAVKLKQADLDHYNRPVVEVWLGDKNINLQMVEEGWAEAYRGKTKRISLKPYLEAEKRAKKKKLGIWKLKNYVSPREFRKKGKSSSSQ